MEKRYPIGRPRPDSGLLRHRKINGKETRKNHNLVAVTVLITGVSLKYKYLS
jgi:hypothetical protein